MYRPKIPNKLPVWEHAGGGGGELKRRNLKNIDVSPKSSFKCQWVFGRRSTHVAHFSFLNSVWYEMLENVPMVGYGCYCCLYFKFKGVYIVRF